MIQRKMCEGCGLKTPSYGLPAEGRKRWCAGRAAAEGRGAVSLAQPKKMLEGCGLKPRRGEAGYGGMCKQCHRCAKPKLPSVIHQGGEGRVAAKAAKAAKLREVAEAVGASGGGMKRQQGGPPANRCEDCEVRTPLQL